MHFSDALFGVRRHYDFLFEHERILGLFMMMVFMVFKFGNGIDVFGRFCSRFEYGNEAYDTSFICFCYDEELTSSRQDGRVGHATI